MIQKLTSVLLALTFFQFSLQAGSDDTTRLAQKDLKILSWNIFMLPGIVPMAGRVARAEAITDTISKLDYDIIVFQEAFHKKAVGKIREGLKNLYPYMYGPYNQPKDAVHISSGVWIVSKIPLKELGVIQFKNGRVADKVALKGAALLEGMANGTTFQILGTHMQAEDKFPNIRREQFDQINKELLSVHKKDGVPQIVCGDMNTRPTENEEYAYMLKTLEAEDGALDGIQKDTYDGTTNKLAEAAWKKAKATFDYILLRKNGAEVSSIKREVSVLRKKWKKNKSDLSDHYGMICELKF